MCFSELFYCFTGITSEGNCGCLPRLTVQATRGSQTRSAVFISENYFENLLRGRIQPSLREECSEIFALKSSQSVLQPKIANLAFQRFLLAAALLQWKMAPTLESMAARYGSPMLCPGPYQPTRTCTS